MLVPQQAADVVDDVVTDSVPTDDVADDVPAADVEPTPPSPPPPTTTPTPPQELPSTSQVEVKVEKNAEVEKNADVQGRLEESQARVYQIDLEYADKVLSMQDDEPEPTELQEVIKVVTTAKLITEVVTAATTIFTTAAPITAATIIAAPSVARRRKGVVIRDPEETATPSTIIHSEPKSKDKGKGIMFEEPKPLKKQAQIEQDKAYAREEDLEMLWQIVEERFASLKPKNFLDDFLLTTLTYMFEKPNVKARVWKNQTGVHDDLAGREKISIDKVHFRADSEQCKTYCCWYKLMPLVNAVDSRLRLLEKNAAVGIR
nr:hypothetical protein [Tanacetum cinerariifolium]